MADSSLNIGITLTGASQAAAATSTLSQGLGAVTIQVNKLQQATTQLNQTQQKSNVAMAQSQAATGNAAMGLLFLSQAVEDAQYGFGAILNNIPLIIMSMNGSAGLAGAVSIAGVAVNILTKDMDFMGTAAKKAAADTKKLADEAKKAADEARILADATNAAEESNQSYVASIDRINNAYDVETAKINSLLDIKKQELSIQLALSKAKSDAAQAELDIQEATGEITDKVVIEKQREEIRKKASQERFELERQQRLAERNAAAQQANEDLKKAQQLASEKDNLRNRSRGLLDEDNRKAIEEQKKSLELSQKESDNKIKKAQEEKALAEVAASRAAASGYNQTQGVELAQKRLLEYTKEKADAEKKAAELTAQLEADTLARKQNGGKDEKAVRDEIYKKDQEILQLNEKARQNAERIKQFDSGMTGATRVFTAEEEAASRKSDARIYKIQSDERKAAEKDLGADSKLDSKNVISGREAGQTGRSISEQLADQGMEKGAAALRSVSDAAATGDTAAIAKLALMIDKLVAVLNRSKDTPASLINKVEDLDRRLEELRSGN